LNWLNKRRSKADDLEWCLVYCAASYAIEPNKEVAYPLLVAAGTVYQMLGSGIRSSVLLRARQTLERDAGLHDLPPHELAVRLAKMDALIRDFSTMKTGLWAATKSKAVLHTLSPELLSAIQNCDPEAVKAFVMQMPS
jgi:hypothetical protein